MNDFVYKLLMFSLGEDHVGYNRLDFPSLKLSVVGGRPFSHGGKQLCRKELLAMRFVSNEESSCFSCSVFSFRVWLLQLGLLVRYLLFRFNTLPYKYASWTLHNGIL